MGDVVEGLFGPTPFEIQQAQRQNINQEANQYANQDPFQRANAGWYRTGAGLADAGAGMMGLVNPQVQEAQKRQAIIAQIKSMSPEDLMKGAQAAQQAGDVKAAFTLMQLAKKREAEIAAAQREEEKLSLQDRKQDFQEGEMLELKKQQLAQQAEVAKQRSEDTRLSIEQRAEAAKESNALRLQIAQLAASNKSEPAPTMTEVVDPKDQTRMLRVNAREYQGGSLGDAGVLGISGKEPSAAKAEEKASQGKSALEDSLYTLRGLYAQLNKLGAIVSKDKGSLANMKARVSASDAGQFAGGVVGTDAQTVRDSINMQRPLLLQAIKEATGMSAKQMDSNAELKLWLATATDPTKSLQANMEALDSIERKYLSGTKPKVPTAPTKPKTAEDYFGGK